MSTTLFHRFHACSLRTSIIGFPSQVALFNTMVASTRQRRGVGSCVPPAQTGHQTSRQKIGHYKRRHAAPPPQKQISRASDHRQGTYRVPGNTQESLFFLGRISELSFPKLSTGSNTKTSVLGKLWSVLAIDALLGVRTYCPRCRIKLLGTLSLAVP